jgi:hypothetical protein
MRFRMIAAGLRTAWLNLLNAYDETGNKQTAPEETARMALMFSKKHWALTGDSDAAR